MTFYFLSKIGPFTLVSKSLLEFVTFKGKEENNALSLNNLSRCAQMASLTLKNSVARDCHLCLRNETS